MELFTAPRKSAEDLIKFKRIMKKKDGEQCEYTVCTNIFQRMQDFRHNNLFIHYSFYYLVITFIMYGCQF